MKLLEAKSLSLEARLKLLEAKSKLLEAKSTSMEVMLKLLEAKSTLLETRLTLLQCFESQAQSGQLSHLFDHRLGSKPKEWIN